MAFVRWRGNCAQLLMTEYVQGKSRQVLLANLNSGYYVTTSTKRYVAQCFPQVVVDWAKVDQSMAKGPPQSPVLAQQEWNFAAVENALRGWESTLAAPQREATLLLQVAEILTRWRTLGPPKSAAQTEQV
jgi:hypothetical protein